MTMVNSSISGISPMEIGDDYDDAEENGDEMDDYYDDSSDEDDDDDDEDADLLSNSAAAAAAAMTSADDLQRARHWLYVSHAFAQGSEQLWQFAIVLFLAAFCHYESMILVSTYGLTCGLVVCWWGSTTASLWIDDDDDDENHDNKDDDDGAHPRRHRRRRRRGFCGNNNKKKFQKHARLRAARFFILTQSASVVLATSLCYFLLKWQQEQNDQPFLNPGSFSDHQEDIFYSDNSSSSAFAQWFYSVWVARGLPLEAVPLLLLLGIHALGPLAQIMDRSFLVAIERDWIVVMASAAVAAGTKTTTTTTNSQEGGRMESTTRTKSETDATTTANVVVSQENDDDDDDKEPANLADRNAHQWLSDTNVMMRQIDLTAQTVAPALAGWLIGSAAVTTNQQTQHNWHDLTGAAILVGCLNLTSLLVEFICTARIYRLVPALQKQPKPQPKQCGGGDNNNKAKSRTTNRRNNNPQQQQPQQHTLLSVIDEEDDDDDNLPPVLQQTAAVQQHQQEEETAAAAAARRKQRVFDGLQNQTLQQQQQQQEEEEQISPTDAAFVSSSSSFVIDAAPTVDLPSSSCLSLSLLPKGLRIYFQQNVSMAGLGLALLYFNVLTFHGLMTAYLVWRGMRLPTIGFWRGVSAAVGLAGTFLFNYSIQRMSLVSTGMWSIALQFVCLTLAVVSFHLPEGSSSADAGDSQYFLSMVLLVLGVCSSRIGLWVFDIAVTQLMQELVPPNVRGMVGGTQQALNSFFELLMFALGLILPDPRFFHYYVTIGYVAVGMAMILFYVGIFRKRESHFSFLLPSTTATTTSELHDQ